MAQDKVKWTKETTAKILLYLHGWQTPDEQNSLATRYDNGVGFNALDAGFCSSVAQQILEGRPFTDKQWRAMMGVLPKYRGQFLQAYEEGALPELPSTFYTWEVPKPTDEEKGLIQIREGRIFWKPNTYPSSQITSIGFRWNKPYWVSYNAPSIDLILQLERMFEGTIRSKEVEEFMEAMVARGEVSLVTENSDLFSFQKEGVSFLLGSPRSMLALAPGLGKTATSVIAAEELKEVAEKVLVIAPLSLLETWRREIHRWTGSKSDIWHGNPSTWKVHSRDFRWVITNYDSVRRHLQTLAQFKWDIVIVDESVLVKNRKAQRSQAVKTLCQKATHCWLLSGAPTTKYFDDLWHQFNILDSARFRSYWRFAHTYCVVDRNKWGTSIVGNQRDASDRIKEDLQDIYFYRSQDDVLDLPDWIWEEPFEIRMDKSQSSLYSQMEDEFLAELPEGDVVVASNVLARLTRLIQIASNPSLIGGKDISAKREALKEILEIYPKPFIIWTNFVATAQDLTRRWGKSYKVATLTGQTPKTQIPSIVDNFQDGNLDILIAHPGVGKFGHTLTAARSVVYLERSYNGDDFYQSIYRVRRIGSQHSPIMLRMLSLTHNGRPTVDHVIDEVLDYRKEQNLKLTTNDLRKLFGENR